MFSFCKTEVSMIITEMDTCSDHMYSSSGAKYCCIYRYYIADCVCDEHISIEGKKKFGDKFVKYTNIGLNVNRVNELTGKSLNFSESGNLAVFSHHLRL